MIAEDYFSSNETAAAGGGTNAVRLNRNLSCIVSTIRDDGPSVAEDGQPLTDDGPDSCSQDDFLELSMDEETVPLPRQQRLRALPGMAVLAKAVGVLVLVVFVAGAVLLATGRYPVLEEQGLRLADLPPGVVAEMAMVKEGVRATVTQWVAQTGLLLSEAPTQSSAMSVPDTADPVWQQQLNVRLDTLALTVEALEVRFGHDQDERRISRLEYRAEQDHQLHALQSRLTGLQEQLAALQVLTPVSQAVTQSINTVTALSAQGDWVVNVASSSQESAITELQQRLDQQGIATEIYHTDRKGELRYRLRVNGFNTGGEAKRYAERLALEHDLKGSWASKR